LYLRNLLNTISEVINIKVMGEYPDDKLKFHASAAGRSHIEEKEFFRTEKVKKMVNKLLDSAIYKQIKGASTPASNVGNETTP
jgi:hypothetical protein